MTTLPVPEYDGAGDGWITTPDDPRLAVLWPGAEDYAEEGIEFPLHVAAVQCAIFAPDLAADATVPENWVAAQIMQARALVRAGIVGAGDQLGLEETVAVFPMDWTVKALLRPRRGRPYFGGRRKAQP
jgi:hypothetical protein